MLDVATLRTRPLSVTDASVACTSADATHALLEQGSVLYDSK